MLGRFIRDTSSRNQVVLATKFGFNGSASPLAADIALTPDQTRRLDEASAPTPGFSAGLAAPAIRRMVFGGNEVTGWGEPRVRAER